MAGRRIIYRAAALAALAFQIFYDGYLAQFLLSAVLALPLFSLAVSLPGLFRLRLHLSASTSRPIQGGQGQWRLEVKSAAFLPVARLTLDLSFENALTGDCRRERLHLFGLSGGAQRTFPLECSHCGQLTCRAIRARALDALGLFSLPVPLPRPVQAVVFPRPDGGPVPPELERLAAQALSPSHRGPAGEEYELRDYHPGDPVRDIHWKLSSKREQLVVRERLRGSRPRVALAPALFGPPQRLDRVLGRLWSASAWLLDRSVPHQIRWTDDQGRSHQSCVSSPSQLEDCFVQLLSARAPEHPVPDLTDPMQETALDLHLTIDAGEEAHP